MYMFFFVNRKIYLSWRQPKPRWFQFRWFSDTSYKRTSTSCSLWTWDEKHFNGFFRPKTCGIFWKFEYMVFMALPLDTASSPLLSLASSSIPSLTSCFFSNFDYCVSSPQLPPQPQATTTSKHFAKLYQDF